MSKTFEVDLEMESRILDAVSPAIDQAYEEHMTSGVRRNLDDSEQVVIGTLDPLKEIYIASGLEEQEIITPELVEFVHGSYQNHVEELESQGLDIRPVVESAGLMIAGTEDNIDWYHAVQYARFRTSDAYMRMLSRWTAEEATHGPLVRLWSYLSGAISSAKAHENSTHQIMGGINVNVESVVSTNAFTDPQEADTVDAHKLLGSICDSVGRKSFNKLAGQEVRHNNMFRKIGNAIYEFADSDQDVMDYVLPIETSTHAHFSMPGEKSYPEFTGEAIKIAVNGLFTLQGVIKRQAERVQSLGLLSKTVRAETAKKAQAKLAQLIDPDSRINRIKQNIVDKATEEYISSEKIQGRVPFILGRTVVIEGGSVTVTPNAV